MQRITKNNDIQQIKCDYDQKCVHYKALGELIRLYLLDSLTVNKISFTDIQFRIKTFHSFFSKIKRKRYYKEPYEKIEDICGVRVICTFKEDLQKVSEIVTNLFNSMPPENKERDIKSKIVGYRGVHQIVRLKPEICKSSTFYRKMDGLKAEIQIRTIVQHSWAEVSHKLNYKDEENVPTEFQNTLIEISSTLSLVDSLYTRLRKEKLELKNKLINKDRKTFPLKQEINLETVASFLDVYFPNRDANDDIELLIEELNSYKITFTDVVAKSNLFGVANLRKIENEILGTAQHSQVGVVRLILSLYYKKYWKDRKKLLPLYFDGNKRIEIIEKWQKNITDE